MLLRLLLPSLFICCPVTKQAKRRRREKAKEENFAKYSTRSTKTKVFGVANNRANHFGSWFWPLSAPFILQENPAFIFIFCYLAVCYLATRHLPCSAAFPLLFGRCVASRQALCLLLTSFRAYVTKRSNRWPWRPQQASYGSQHIEDCFFFVITPISG